MWVSVRNSVINKKHHSAIMAGFYIQHSCFGRQQGHSSHIKQRLSTKQIAWISF